MNVAVRLLLAGIAIVTLPRAITAQQQVYQGAFARAYPHASGLLLAYDIEYGAMLDRLFLEGAGASGPPGASLPRQGPDGNPGTGTELLRAAMPGLASQAPALLDILLRTHSLRDEMYDILADDRVIDRQAAAEGAIDRYLAGSRGMLPVRPKSAPPVTGSSPGGGPGGVLPASGGIARAFIWLQLATFDALLYHSTSAERRAGIDLVVERFRQKLDSPEAAPTAMPTPPAISPALVREHPRAAVIFDNLHLLQERLVTVLSDPRIPDRRRAVEEAIAQATDPSFLALSESEWMLRSLRQGIYFQGGPAVGALPRNERNVDGNHLHHRTIMPGMGSGPDGDVVLPGDAVVPGNAEPPPAHQH